MHHKELANIYLSVCGINRSVQLQEICDTDKKHSREENEKIHQQVHLWDSFLLQ
jgi:hypothetical protein